MVRMFFRRYWQWVTVCARKHVWVLLILGGISITRMIQEPSFTSILMFILMWLAIPVIHMNYAYYHNLDRQQTNNH